MLSDAAQPPVPHSPRQGYIATGNESFSFLNDGNGDADSLPMTTSNGAISASASEHDEDEDPGIPGRPPLTMPLAIMSYDLTTVESPPDPQGFFEEVKLLER